MFLSLSFSLPSPVSKNKIKSFLKCSYGNCLCEQKSYSSKKVIWSSTWLNVMEFWIESFELLSPKMDRERGKTWAWRDVQRFYRWRVEGRLFRWWNSICTGRRWVCVCLGTPRVGVFGLVGLKKGVQESDSRPAPELGYGQALKTQPRSL